MATAKKPAPYVSTDAVGQYRERQAKKGAKILYTVIDAESVKALDVIMFQRVCTKRDAVEQALQRYAKDLQRKR